MKIKQFIPTLRVKDARQSERFYCDILGFTKEWEHQFNSDSPLMMSIHFDEHYLFLSEHQGTGGSDCTIYMRIDDIDAFYREKSGQGLAFEMEPVDEPWGMREASFRDPDNHRFIIGMDIS